VPDDQGALVELASGSLGGAVVELRQWAEQQSDAKGRGDRDSAPRHHDRAWHQVSVSARECLGRSNCPFGQECFAERARDEAFGSSLIVTNHSLLAIDAIDGVPMIPEYDAVVVDEAHELTGRVTQAATDELSAAMVDRAGRRARNAVREGEAPDDLVDAADALRDAVAASPVGRLDALPTQLVDALALVRDSARACWSAIPKDDGDADPVRQQARALTDEVRKVAERMAGSSERDVLWVAERDPARGGNELRVAPLDVSVPLREKLFRAKTVVLTSATLKLGGGFEPVAVGLGLRADERVDGEPLARWRRTSGASVPRARPNCRPGKPDSPVLKLRRTVRRRSVGGRNPRGPRRPPPRPRSAQGHPGSTRSRRRCRPGRWSPAS